MNPSFKVGDPRLVGPALQAFTQIAESWSLTEMEQSALLGQPIAIAFALRDSVAATNDRLQETLERVGHLIAIYRLLNTIFTVPDQANSWIRRPSSALPFEGDCALGLMCSGRLQDLSTVRQHLEIEGLGPA